MVSKAAACGLPDDSSRHLRDLALLCALVDDPFGAADELDAKDRKRLRFAGVLDDPDHPAWRLVPVDRREGGRSAWAILNTPPTNLP